MMQDGKLRKAECELLRRHIEQITLRRAAKMWQAPSNDGEDDGDREESLRVSVQSVN